MTQTTASKPPAASSKNQSHDESQSFQLKAGRLTLTQLELYSYNYDDFNRQMSKIFKQAPHFFDQTPVVLTLDKINNPDKKVDFIELTQLCQEYGMFPIAVRGGTEELQLAALVAGLPSVSNHNKTHETDEKLDDQASTEASDTDETDSRPSKIVTKPVRSGQQIYASGGDLILLAPVSTGAEVLADGNIHIYAPLRGRALAGIRGNKSAHIFCQQLEAELISIAGHYKMSEDLQGAHWGKAVHAQLIGQHLRLKDLHT